MTKPFWPGTGIPYCISPLAFPAGAADAGRTVGGDFSSLGGGFDGSSIGVGLGLGSAAFDIRDAGRRELRVFLGCCCGGGGWKAFEMDWPTFLKKSPTGSACAGRSFKKKRATTSKEIQRERIRRLIGLSALTVKP
jgi:hypothetical protein